MVIFALLLMFLYYCVAPLLVICAVYQFGMVIYDIVGQARTDYNTKKQKNERRLVKDGGRELWTKQILRFLKIAYKDAHQNGRSPTVSSALVLWEQTPDDVLVKWIGLDEDYDLEAEHREFGADKVGEAIQRRFIWCKKSMVYTMSRYGQGCWIDVYDPTLRKKIQDEENDLKRGSAQNPPIKWSDQPPKAEDLDPADRLLDAMLDDNGSDSIENILLPEYEADIEAVLSDQSLQSKMALATGKSKQKLRHELRTHLNSNQTPVRTQ